MSKIGSEKYSNSEYAPGIATYGIDGTDGKSGKNGTTVFVSQYSTDGVGLSNFGTAILQNLNMSLNDNNKLNRDYIEGDCFLFSNGTIWKIVDLNGLKAAAASNQLTSIEVFSKYMEQVGSIVSSAITDGFTTSIDNRLVLDTTNYKGFIVNIAGLSSEQLKDSNITAPFVIASNDADNDDKIQFINMRSIFSGVDESELNIYYDSNNDAYHISSENPIVIDANLLVSSDNTEDFDEYSKIITNDNPVTSFKGLCENIGYTVNMLDVDDNWNLIKPFSEDDENEESDAVVLFDEYPKEDEMIDSSNRESDEESTIKKICISLTFTNRNENIISSVSNILNTSMIHVIGIVNNKVEKEFYYQCSEENSLNKISMNIHINTYINTEYTYTWRVSVIGNVEIFLNQTTE